MDKQWEAKPYYEYAPLFLTPKNIDTGRNKLIEHREILDRIERDIGVDREIVVAIWGIETRYGTNQGAFNVLRTLNTLFAAYPRRSDFFRKELVQFLLLCKENGVDPKTVNGSYAAPLARPSSSPPVSGPMRSVLTVMPSGMYGPRFPTSWPPSPLPETVQLDPARPHLLAARPRAEGRGAASRKRKGPQGPGCLAKGKRPAGP